MFGPNFSFVLYWLKEQLPVISTRGRQRALTEALSAAYEHSEAALNALEFQGEDGANWARSHLYSLLSDLDHYV